jgi:hypothetical protein
VYVVCESLPIKTGLLIADHKEDARVHSSFRSILTLAVILLSGCAQQTPQAPELTPAQIQAQIVRLIPAKVQDREGWARDIQGAFTAQKLAATTENLCAVMAVIEQESTFQSDPGVPGLGRIARDEINRRASKLYIPDALINTALKLPSSTGKSYGQRLDSARSEQELSAIFDDFIDRVPLGQTLFGRFNPVHTAGPMQVSVEFAQQQAKDYPYPVPGSLRNEVFSRRGGVYFGTLHLLGYPANYPKTLYRFADFNAGWYASRNAAFQSAVNLLTGSQLALDGDLILYDSTSPGATELAVRSLGPKLGMNNSAIWNQLKQGETLAFEEGDLYQRIFAMAEQKTGKPLPRAILPGITLQSPKITRKLTTAWFAERVDERRARCVQRGGGD